MTHSFEDFDTLVTAEYQTTEHMFPAIVWHRPTKLERVTEWLATSGTVLAMAGMLVAAIATMAH